MTGYLTTHVLDTARGCPAAGLEITLYRVSGDTRVVCATATTNADGRTDTPILDRAGFALGEYELVFGAGGYLRANGMPDDFLDVIPLRFRMGAQDHYHVPLLLSPFGYSTYRGS